MFDRVRRGFTLFVFVGVLLAILWWLRDDTEGGLWVGLGWTWLALPLVPSFDGFPAIVHRFALLASPFSRAGAFIAGGTAIAGGLLYHLLRNGILVLLIMVPLAVVLVSWEQRWHEQRRALRRGAGKQQPDFRKNG